MQHAVAKHFIYRKHNITIPHTQVIPQKVVTFFENLKSWSHLALFVWDWIAGENRIASDFPRFYRIAKCVSAQNLAGSVPNAPTSANLLIQKKEQKSLLLESVIPAGFEPTTDSLEGVKRAFVTL